MLDLAITGGPYSGKTTLAGERGRKTGARVIHTDDYIDLGWSEASDALAELIVELDEPAIMEGVAVPRVLRKYLARYDDLPARRVWYLGDCWGKRDRGQLAMTKGIQTVLNEIEEELVARGCVVSRRWAGDPQSIANLGVLKGL